MIVAFIIIILITTIFLLIFPFKFTIWNEDEYLHIKIAKALTVKINLLILFDNNHNDEIKKQVKFLKLFNKVNVSTLSFKASGLHNNYEYSGVTFGYLNAILPIIKVYFATKNIDFSYDLNYMGDKSVNFKCIFYSKLATIIKETIGGKKDEGTSY